MKTRYAKQKDNFRCGPYAILNALKWAGASFSERKHLKKISRVVRCSRNGTGDREMSLGLWHYYQYFRDFKIKNLPAIRILNRHLRNGGAVIMDIHYRCKKTGVWLGHWIFIEKITKRGYKVINYEASKSTVSFVNPRTLMNEIENNKRYWCGTFSCSWFLERW